MSAVVCDCGHDIDRHGPEASGCIECRCIAYADQHDWAPEWVTCPECKGEQTIRQGELDVDCPTCDGDGGWEP